MACGAATGFAGETLSKRGNGGLLDLLMAKTKPQFVRYELAVFWGVHPGCTW
jgi:hypothetical protein